jgi:hypothetical protein
VINIHALYRRRFSVVELPGLSSSCYSLVNVDDGGVVGTVKRLNDIKFSAIAFNGRVCREMVLTTPSSAAWWVEYVVSSSFHGKIGRGRYVRDDVRRTKLRQQYKWIAE